MELQSIVGLVQSVGFPIMVAGWLLWRTDQRLEKQTEVLNAIVVGIEKLVVIVRDGDNK